ncbi:hypothetical protein [Actinacidiphila rubida]|uniref:Asp23/Gls24 family envelope stress response protein n=1 Tax=Actinacidiphila rubida TaxID=310780 RepID=A0A1H8ELD2_9ACTN|nr:hypothetical protein [Actinacidiphila rubida]SEN20206.1 hypothetical protein SAMN05216267_1002266 [Actinacidiphila rubida]
MRIRRRPHSPPPVTGDTGRLPPPAERGATVIPGPVVARLTAGVAAEALARRTGGPLAHAGLGTPRSTVRVRHGSARIAVSLDLPYPGDAGRSCDELGREITERVSHLTALPIEHVTVSVRRLVLTDGPGRRVH